MIDKTLNKKTLLMNYRPLLILFLIMPFYFFKNTFIKSIGSISIIMMLLLTVFDVIYKMDSIKLNETWVWFWTFSSYSLVMLLRTPTAKALYMFILQVALLLFITLLTTVNLNKKTINGIFKGGKALYLILLLPAGIIALEGGRGAFGRFNNVFSPVIYKLLLPCTFFFIAGSKNKLLKLLLFSFIYFRMVERTSSIVLIIIYTIYLILKKVKSSRRLYKSVFFGTIIIIIGFTCCYVQLQYYELGDIINIMFMRYTGGNFFSGRNIIWQAAFNNIKDKLVFGYGIDNGVLSLERITQSAHNTYIHILLQGGLTGLFIFLMFIYSIWKRYYIHLENDIVITAAAYLIGVLVFINFEVTLIGNTTVVACFLWLILGIGLMECNIS